jgi:copper chaperone CopZ
MTTILVPDMHCEKCVERITNALKEGKLTFQVSLENKTVTVDGQEAQVTAALEALDDLGFDAQKQA